MEDEREVPVRDPDVADVAGDGREPETEEDRGGVREADQRDADGEGREDSALSAVERAGDQTVDSSVLHPQVVADEHELELELVAIAKWEAPLPAPDDFARYTHEAQEHILEMHRMQVESSVRRKDRLVEASIQRDAEASARADRLADAEIAQTPRARRATVVINVSVLIAVVICAAIGQAGPATTLAAALGVINVMAFFVPLMSRPKSSEASGAEPGEKDM